MSFFCLWLNFVLILSINNCYALDRGEVVFTKNGFVKGKIFMIGRGQIIHGFLGVPYAKPPVGRYRFKEPIPLTEYTDGIYLAQDFKPRCPQYITFGSNTKLIGNEDCLYLNIYTPSLSVNSKLDVMFFIHGGGFQNGGSEDYSPEYIMNYHRLVLVTINYRLGLFGFLSTEDEALPGNNGLKDQVVALKWVRDNIREFGGDENKITIVGEDAGAVSVHFHYLSPMSQKLFNQGISVGGSALCPWALAKKSRSRAFTLAEKFNCNITTSKSLVHCLKDTFDFKLMGAARLEWYKKSFEGSFSYFGPVVEKVGENKFLHDEPYKLLKKGEVKVAPWLVGLTTHEGLYPGAKFIVVPELMEELDENWHDIAPHFLYYNDTVPEDMKEIVSEKIRMFYFEDQEISIKYKKEFIRMLSDRFYVTGTETAMKLQASATRALVFFYQFGYKGRYSKSYSICNCKENLGVSHGDDLLYIFKNPEFNITTSPNEKRMMTKMLHIWTSFMEKGFPKVDNDTYCKPVSYDTVKIGIFNYMRIETSHNIYHETIADLGNQRFWTSLHLAEMKNVASNHKRYFDEL